MRSALPMTIWLGAYFATTDLRLCNAYSQESQSLAGWAIAALSTAVGFGWLTTVCYRIREASLDERPSTADLAPGPHRDRRSGPGAAVQLKAPARPTA